MSKKSTIKNDPFALVIPEQEEASAPAATVKAESASQPQGRGQEPKPATAAHKKEKLTVHLTHDLIERVKNAAYWNPRLTIAAIAERGIIEVIQQIEQEHGGPYPPREAELKGGRPIGSTSARRMPETP
jgi:hypothetical protein